MWRPAKYRNDGKVKCDERKSSPPFNLFPVLDNSTDGKRLRVGVASSNAVEHAAPELEGGFLGVDEP